MHFTFRFTPVALAAALSLAGCGGDPSTATTTTAAASETFPTGLSVGTPTELSATTQTSSIAPWNGVRYAADLGRAAWTALWKGDTRTLAQLATALVPAGRAHAADAVESDVKAQAVVIEKVLNGDTSVSLASVLDLGLLFHGSNNASCYGPTLAYSSHQDASGGQPAAGTLPSGDLGLWTATQGAANKPCVAAQLNARVAGVKGRTKQGLLLMAVMRLAVVNNSLTMPGAGNSIDLKSVLQSTLSAVPAFATVTVDAATIALDSAGTLYTYRLALSNGSGASARSGEVILKHTPGSSATAYSGVMQVAGFHLSNDAAFGCTDQVEGALYKVANVSTLKYSRAGSEIEFGSRDAHYCGHQSSTTSTNYAADVATFTSDGQLDPAAKLTGNARGATLGWRGNFTRFAGAYDRVDVDGNFLFTWQAGTGDGNSRALAAHVDYNSSTSTRILSGYFGFAGDVATTNGSLLGMICNWAGPGNNHTPVARFQSQTATLASSATEYTLAASKIAYAPTNSCSSTTTAYDVNVNGTIAAGEGVGTTSDLDVPAGANSVQQEIESRGFAKPALF
jgi:hypothetical protein